MPRVSKPGDFGLGGAKLSPMQISSRRRGTASPDAFGAGRSVESYGGGLGPDAFGAGRNLESFGGGRTAESFGTGPALIDERTELNAMSAYLTVKRQDEVLKTNNESLGYLADDNAWYQERKGSVTGDPGTFTKDLGKAYDERSRARLDGATGIRRKILEQDALQTKGKLLDRAMDFEASSRRGYREQVIKGQIDQATNAVYLNPGDRPDVEKKLHDQVDSASALPADVRLDIKQSISASLAQAEWRRRVEDDPLSTMQHLTTTDVPGMKAQDRMELIGHAGVVLRQEEAQRRQTESDQRRDALDIVREQRQAASDARAADASARAEARFQAADAREQTHVQREEAEAGLTAAIMDGSLRPEGLQAYVASRIISGDQARTLAAFAKAQKNEPDSALAVDLMTRASSGDSAVLSEAADAAAQGRLPIDQLRQITNDVQEFQRSGGVFAREDVKEAEGSIKHVLEESDALGLSGGDKNEKAFAALRMFRTAMQGDEKQDPLDLATKVIDVWKQGAGRVPRPRYLVQPPGGKPDFAASAQATLDALGKGEIDEQEAGLQAQALEIMQREMGRGK